MKCFPTWKRIPVITGIVLLFLSACCKPEITGNVANTLRPQETANWCWAATTQMLAQHLGVAITQCSLANQAFGRTDCCNPQTTGTACPKTNACNSPGWIMLDAAGCKSDESTTALTWENLRKQIFCTKKPIAWAYGTSGVVGHVVIVKGYLTLSGTNYVVLNDPWGPCMGQERIITYAEYTDPAGTSTHWNTWYNIAKK